MKAYLWSPYSRTYHRRDALTERCNVDALTHRREADDPPRGKTLCRHCEAQAAWEQAQP